MFETKLPADLFENNSFENVWPAAFFETHIFGQRVMFGTHSLESVLPGSCLENIIFNDGQQNCSELIVSKQHCQLILKHSI